MSVPFVTIKLDRPRDIRFANSRLIQAEQAMGKKFWEIQTNVSAEDCFKLLHIGLLWQDSDLTEAKLNDIIDDSDTTLEDRIEAVYLALNYGIQGKPKTDEAMEIMQEATGKNVNGLTGTGTEQ